MAPSVLLMLSKVKAVHFSENCQSALTASYLEKVLSVAFIVTSLDVAWYFLIF